MHNLRNNTNSNYFQIVNNQTPKTLIPFKNMSSRVCTKVSATKSNQMVVLRSALRPNMMTKVIGLSPPGRPAATASVLIPSDFQILN